MENYIKNRRLELEMTQEELARKCDITLGQIRNIEKMRQIPSLYFAYKIKRALQVKNLEELFPDNDII
jgi:putative transcriptional regulator